ncbi:hypothetical protein Enr13x_39620 [Stieleria neptunia]|uniref:Uncharacterized protein n=2 Tax=Stieleria neptunia TaxID=2527979 RepID=A0A518HTF0_9BACT|nr:hypothetical protein Enr13x_39620 [Stieleria neptunia]
MDEMRQEIRRLETQIEAIKKERDSFKNTQASNGADLQMQIAKLSMSADELKAENNRHKETIKSLKDQLHAIKNFE